MKSILQPLTRHFAEPELIPGVDFRIKKKKKAPACTLKPGLSAIQVNV